MRTSILSLFLAAAAWAQPPVTCALPFQAFAKDATALALITQSPFGPTCEWVQRDPSTQFRRDGTGAKFISGLPAPPPIDFGITFSGEFQASGQLEDVQNPPTPFDSQPIWCAKTTQVLANNISQPLSPNQLKYWFPIILMEVRQGTGTSQLLLNNLAWPDNARHRWTQSHPKCGGAPAMTFAAGAEILYQDDASGPRPLLQMWITSLVPKN